MCNIFYARALYLKVMPLLDVHKNTAVARLIQNKLLRFLIPVCVLPNKTAIALKACFEILVAYAAGDKRRNTVAI